MGSGSSSSSLCGCTGRLLDAPGAWPVPTQGPAQACLRSSDAIHRGRRAGVRSHSPHTGATQRRLHRIGLLRLSLGDHPSGSRRGTTSGEIPHAMTHREMQEVIDGYVVTARAAVDVAY